MKSVVATVKDKAKKWIKGKRSNGLQLGKANSAPPLVVSLSEKIQEETKEQEEAAEFYSGPVYESGSGPNQETEELEEEIDEIQPEPKLNRLNSTEYYNQTRPEAEIEEINETQPEPNQEIEEVDESQPELKLNLLDSTKHQTIGLGQPIGHDHSASKDDDDDDGGGGDEDDDDDHNGGDYKTVIDEFTETVALFYSTVSEAARKSTYYWTQTRTESEMKEVNDTLMKPTRQNSRNTRNNECKTIAKEVAEIFAPAYSTVSEAIRKMVLAGYDKGMSVKEDWKNKFGKEGEGDKDKKRVDSQKKGVLKKVRFAPFIDNEEVPGQRAPIPVSTNPHKVLQISASRVSRSTV